MGAVNHPINRATLIYEHVYVSEMKRCACMIYLDHGGRGYEDQVFLGRAAWAEHLSELIEEYEED